MSPAPLLDFNYWITAARDDLRHGQKFRHSPHARVGYLQLAETNLTRALKAANRLRDAQRRGLCLKALNWVRTDLKNLNRSAA